MQQRTFPARTPPRHAASPGTSPAADARPAPSEAATAASSFTPPRTPSATPKQPRTPEQGRTPRFKAEFFRLEAADLRAVLALERQCFSLPWSEKQFRLAFEQKVFSVFGLRETGRLLAYASVYHAAGELEILNVAVLPERRRRGLGRRLLGLLLQVARKMGITRAVLEVRTGNAPAIALYEGLGFARAGLRPRYYTDTGEDALIYALDLA